MYRKIEKRQKRGAMMENPDTSTESNVILSLGVNDYNFDFSTSITTALSEAEDELILLNETVDSIKALKPQCDKTDYILAACSGALCGIFDIFLVGKPGESPIGNVTDKWFANRTIDFAKLINHQSKGEKEKKFNSLYSAISYLEGKFKVPYDQTVIGESGKIVFNLNTKNHHFKSLGHHPSLFGLFFSILDQFTNQSHFVTGGQFISLQQADGEWRLEGEDVPHKIACGIVNWFGHLISDMSGSHSSAGKGNRGMGIPSPLWTWIDKLIVIKTKCNLPISDLDKGIEDLALQIFKEGFDLRFQATQTIPVCLNEFVVRFLHAVRRLVGYFINTPKEERSFHLMWEKCEPFKNPTIKRMLTVAHGTFVLLDVGDAAIRGVATGGGSFNFGEFFLRLNIVGCGRFLISLYGEGKRAIIYYGSAKQEAEFSKKKTVIVENYIEGLKILAIKYNDSQLLTFVRDFQESDAYVKVFQKSAELAELREVPAEKIMKTKADIDNYFRGK